MSPTGSGSARKMRWGLVFGLALAGLSVAGPGAAQSPWDGAPFAAAPKDVLKAASAAADDKSDVVVLLEEGRFVFDAQGRCDYTYRLVYRVQTQAGAANWATVGTEWAPWYEERPQIRARVVTSAGQAHWLDPKTIAEAGVNDENPEIFTDRKRLRAPLPALQVGSVVEEEIHAPDKAAQFASGSAYTFRFGGGMPTRKVRVSVDAPEGLPLHHVLRGTDGLTVERERAAGRVRLSVQAGPLAPLPAAEPGMPSDRPRGPYFAFSTGASWAAIAESYARTVDAQIGVPALSAARAGVRREEVAARLLKRLHAEVRYTGVEFGESAIVPQPPAEVLKRKYGDCKDKSALLASWLRAEGVPAFLALLQAGPGADVDPELPGLGRFNHAILVLPGTPNLWIDATDEFARVGELPVSAQDRLALVAAAGTTNLVRTPAAQAADNTLRKTREIRLVGSGGGQVVETTRATGAIERAYRSFYAHMEPKALRESQEKYAKNEHQAVVVAARSPNPRDLTVPFELRVESKDSGRAASDGKQAVVTIAPGGLFSRLPEFLTDAEGPAEPRRQPLALAEPYRLEWNYRIVPPPGFVLKTLPETEKASLGPASIEVRFARLADGGVEGRVAFDSGPRLVEPKAFDELRTAVMTWRDREPLRVEFEEKAQALAESGSTCAALGEARKAADLQAKQAAPRGRLAEMLLEAGFGEPARDEARRAVALEPASSSAHRVLGWMLEHDALGRRFKPGWDRAGAEAAYKKAKELDPKDPVARASLAILYEYDADGVHYGPGAALEASVREIQALRTELKNTRLDVNLMISLFRSQRFAELERFARTLPAETDRDEFLVAVVGAQKGAKAAVLEATRLISDAARRRDALLHAGNSLIEARLYPEGAALVAESAAGAADASTRRARADLFARVKRYETLDLTANEPRAVVRRLFAMVADQVAGTAAPPDLFEVVVASDEDRRNLLRDPESVRRDLLRGLRAVSGGEPFSRGTVDLILAVADLVADGDPDTGFRVRMRTGDRSQSMYVVRRDNRYRVLAPAPSPTLMAEEAWRLVDGGRAQSAARWLDWLREDMGPVSVSGDEPLSGPPFLRLWGPSRPRNENAIRVATASLFATPARVTQGIQMLKVWRETLPAGAARHDIDFALMALYVRGERPAEVLKAAEGLAAAYPHSEVAFESRLGALVDLGRRPEARALAEQRLRSKPDDQSALRSLAQLASQEGRYPDAERIFAQMGKAGRIEAIDQNNRAWNAVLLGRLDDSMLEWAQQAAQSKRASGATLHTLATVYAEKGRVKEAQQLLAQSVAVSAGDRPGPEDWYVVGRLAEQCGITDYARVAYGRAEDKSTRLDSPAVLSRKGLARLVAPTTRTKRATR